MRWLAYKGRVLTFWAAQQLLQGVQIKRLSFKMLRKNTLKNINYITLITQNCFPHWRIVVVGKNTSYEQLDKVYMQVHAFEMKF